MVVQALKKNISVLMKMTFVVLTFFDRISNSTRRWPSGRPTGVGFHTSADSDSHLDVMLIGPTLSTVHGSLYNQ